MLMSAEQSFSFGNDEYVGMAPALATLEHSFDIDTEAAAVAAYEGVLEHLRLPNGQRSLAGQLVDRSIETATEKL